MIKRYIQYVFLVCLTITTSIANASHFRGGAINAEVSANGLVTLSQTSFWANGDGNDFGSGVLNRVNWSGGVGGIQNFSESINTSDARFEVGTGTAQFQLPGAGLYSYTYNTCCRVSGGQNFSGSYNVEGAISWDGITANAPILFDFASVSNEVVVGDAYNQNLNAVGVGLTYDQALNVGITSQPPWFVVDPVTVLMQIDGTDTATYMQNTANDGADYAFSGNIKATDGSFVQYDWVLDVVTAASNLAPDLTDIVINGLVGDIFNGTMVGNDPEGNALTWFVQSLIGIDLTNFIFDINTQAFSFDSSSLTAGTYIANIGASDGALNGFGAITFNLSNAQPKDPTTVPEPSAIMLFLIAGLALSFTNKKNTNAKF